MTGPERKPFPSDPSAIDAPEPSADTQTAPPAAADAPDAPSESADDAIDPVLEGLLAQLWEAANDTRGKVWSLAKLSKRSRIPQSTLRRYLSSLTEAGIVTVTLDETGLGSSTLTEFGRTVCADLFGTDAPAGTGA